MFALIVVPGASVWNWVRTNILFGVFGVGSYVLAPMLYTLPYWWPVSAR
ncbi:MAG: hypothetical protein ACLRZH_11700 [Ruthenibacterium lactatiformans]